MSTHDLARRFLHKVIPKSLHGAVKAPYYKLRSSIRALRRAAELSVTRRDLVEGLRSGGIELGDVICVHSSLSEIGKVKGGPATLIAALQEAVGNYGTILMPAYGSAAEVFSDPRPTVDLRTEPARTGVVTETFRNTPGILRSSHPYASICAWGKHAAYIVSGHDRDATSCHESSPLTRLWELNGTIVGIGTTIGTQSFFHVAEDSWDGFPFETYEPAEPITYIAPDGTEVTRPVARSKPDLVSIRIDHPNNFWIRDMMTKHMSHQSVMKFFQLGRATSWTMNSRIALDEVKALASKGITQYSVRGEVPENWPRAD